MFEHKIWIEKDANIDVVIGNKKQDLTNQLFKDKGFTREWVLAMPTSV